MPRSSLTSENLDFFDGLGQPIAADDLPGLADLYRMFDIYNRQYFGGKLPEVKISYSKRMMVAGGYYPSRKEIRISRKYHQLFPDEVYDTLKHEMIHIIHFKHDAAFKKMARKIGASIKANAHPSLRRPPKYVYICPGCFAEYPRQKRLRMASCGRCSKGGFDRRFKLVLKKRLKQAARN